jgi:hypothetical protein
MSNRTCFWGVKRGQRVMLTTSPPSMSRLYRQCGILNISQPYRLPWPDMGIDLLYLRVQSSSIEVHTSTKCISRMFELCIRPHNFDENISKDMHGLLIKYQTIFLFGVSNGERVGILSVVV